MWAALDSLSHANLLESRLAPPAGTQRVGRRTLLRHVATGSVAAAALGSFVVNTAEAASPAEQVKKLSAEQNQKAGALAQEQAQKIAARNEESRAKQSMERDNKQDAAREEHAKGSMEHDSKSTSNREVETKNSFGGSSLDLGDGWTSYGRGYQPAAFTRSGDLVVLGGLIGGDLSAGQVLAFLPEGQRPVAGHIFLTYSRVNGREGVARVEVQPDGQVVLVGQSASGLVLSLSGISFRAHEVARRVVNAPGMQEERMKLSAEEHVKSSAVEQDQKQTSLESSRKINAEQDSKLQMAERNAKVDAEQDVKLRNQEEEDKLRNQEQADKARVEEENQKLSAVEQRAKTQ